MSKVLLRGAARRDLIEIVYHYLDEGSPTTASRFRQQAEGTFQRLAARPGLGTRYEATDPAFGEIRYFPLPSRFKMYLLFYRPIEGGIEIARILHRARDVHSILAEDFGVTGEGVEGGGAEEDR